MFLTDEEVEFLSGRKYSAYQRRYFVDHGIPFVTSCCGRPRVLRSAVEDLLAVKSRFPGKPAIRFDKVR